VRALPSANRRRRHRQFARLEDQPLVHHLDVRTGIDRHGKLEHGSELRLEVMELSKAHIVLERQAPLPFSTLGLLGSLTTTLGRRSSNSRIDL
jgi:hypothetical protein